LLPAALSTGIGSETQRPLATVIVGGMLLTPALILLLMPVLLSFLPARTASAAAEGKELKSQRGVLVGVDRSMNDSELSS